jgi:hypothetical protein
MMMDTLDALPGQVWRHTTPPVGIKHDSGKPMFHCLDAEALLDLGRVAEFGARKYGLENWRQVDDASRRYFDAAIRHLLASRSAMCDNDSGLPHLAHAAWNCLACLALAKGDTHD